MWTCLENKGAIKITVSKAAQRATEKYAKENYDRILVKFPKGYKGTDTSHRGNGKRIH